jgi:integrase
MKKELPPIDFAALTARGKQLSVAVLSLNSQKSRAADWRLFSRWCERAGRVAMPADQDTIVMYAVYSLDRGLSVKTVVHHCCTVSSIHKDNGHPSPCGPAVNNIFRGARRDLTREKTRGPKLAITPAELLEISCALGSTPIEIRDRAVLTFGFHSGMRRSEISDLDLSDLNFGPSGITVTIRKAKGDQEGKGEQIGIDPGQNAATCPVKTLEEWLRIRGDQPGPLFLAVNGGRPQSQPGVGRRAKDRRNERWPVVPDKEFRGKEASVPIETLYQRLIDQFEHLSQPPTVSAEPVTGIPPLPKRRRVLSVGDDSGRKLSHKRLRGSGINDVVKHAVALIGKDPAKFGGHSLRSSMVTAAVSSGEDVLTIMRRTRHKTLTVLKGYDRPSLFARNPLGRTGL